MRGDKNFNFCLKKSLHILSLQLKSQIMSVEDVTRGRLLSVSLGIEAPNRQIHYQYHHLRPQCQSQLNLKSHP